ncbi:hypothetical protein BRC82_01995 [Halobacteriales archaeon QS_1_67_19]|nr:MAG: hypothetical protein BRC82_01995 [Halobacteriales archaeon QS_1_67_19]
MKTDRLAIAASENEGLFGLPHGVLSSPDEWIALAIGLAAVAAAWLYDGDLDLAPIRTAAVVGIAVSIGLSLAAPPIVTDEWHIPVIVVTLALGGGFVLFRRRRDTGKLGRR